MDKLIKNLNIFILYTLLFVALSIIVFFNFYINGKALVVLEIFLAGLSFVAYCKYNKKSKFATAVGALIYTFSGFLLYTVVKNPITAKAAITLPLMFLGIDKALKKDNYLVLLLSSAISALPVIDNVYSLCITTFFALLYTFIKYFNESKGKKKFCIKFIKIVFFYLIGVLGISLITLHTVSIFKNVKITPNFEFTYYDFDYYVKSLYMATTTAFWSKAYILPIVLTMLPITVLNFKKNKENRTWLILFLVLIVLFAVPWFSYMLNGFTFEPNKWGFVFSFVLAYIVTINIRNDLIYSPREFKFVKKVLALYLVIWFLVRSHAGNFALLSIIFAFIYLIILVARSLDFRELKKNQQFVYAQDLKTPESNAIKARVKVILIIALCCNIIFFSWYLFDKLKYTEAFTKQPVSILSTYREINFEYDGKNKDKIVIDNKNLKFTSKNKSINIKINDTISERSELYLIISNLKYNKNNQYTVTAKYDGISSKYTVRDFVKTPSYIHVPDIVIYIGKYTSNVDSIKLTLSKGSYTLDNIKLISIEK